MLRIVEAQEVQAEQREALREGKRHASRGGRTGRRITRSNANSTAAASQKRHAIDTGGGTEPSCHLIAIQVVPQINTVTK